MIGSTDNTEKLVEKWMNESIIEIKYIKQENQGKHIAHNTAVMNCTTEYFLILDSDDFLNSKAIEILEQDINTIEDNEKVSGIIGNRFYMNDHTCIGKRMPDKLKYSTGLELYQKYKVKGDTIRLYKTKILKKYLFPKIEGEKFIYENVVFDIIDNNYKLLINKEELYYCCYIEDGYTKNANKVKVRNPKGYALSLKSSATYSINYLERMKYTILYIIWTRKYGIDKELKKYIMEILVYPIAIVFEKIKYPKTFFSIMEEK